MKRMPMKTTALFDFDGVVADTEFQYVRLWKRLGEKYGAKEENFPYLIKGMTLPNILKTYFSHLSTAECRAIDEANRAFDEKLDFIPVPGVLDFIVRLKKDGIKTGLVTSSGAEKMERAFRVMKLDGLFGTTVFAERITRGKPDPMCYRLAATDLASAPEDCVVFEDAWNGIQAGTAAGMRVIGISTTLSPEELEGKVYAVIPDFSDKKTLYDLFK